MTWHAMPPQPCRPCRSVPRRGSRTALAVTLAAALGTTACATGGSPAAALTPAVPLAATWQGAATEPGAGVRQRWWTALADPVLDQLVDQALQASPDLRSAQLRLREVRARRAQAAAAESPSLTAGANASRSRSAAGRSSNLFDVGFDASWEADLFGRVRSAVAGADADLGAAAASLGDVRVSLAAEVVRVYLQLRGAQQRQDVALRSAAKQADTLQLTRWRAQAGLVSELDVLQARTSLQQTQAQQAALQAAVRAALLQLDGLLGQPAGAAMAVPGVVAAQQPPPQPAQWPATSATPPPPAAAASGSAGSNGSNGSAEAAAPPALPLLPQAGALALPAEVLRQRADVRQAEWQWRAEVARSAQARAATLPRLNLSGSIGLQAVTLGGLGDGAYASLAAGLLAPIFDAGSLRAQVAAQAAVQDRLAVAYEKTMLGALSEVEVALSSLASSGQQATALAQAVNTADQTAQLTLLRYRSGLVDFRSVLDADRTLLGTQDNLVSARTDALQAWVALHKALGGGWQPEAAAASGAVPNAAPATATVAAPVAAPGTTAHPIQAIARP